MTTKYEDLGNAYKAGKTRFNEYQQKCKTFTTDFLKKMNLFLGLDPADPAQSRVQGSGSLQNGVHPTAGELQNDGSWLFKFTIRLDEILPCSLRYTIAPTHNAGGVTGEAWSLLITVLGEEGTIVVASNDSGFTELCHAVFQLAKQACSNPLSSFAKGKNVDRFGMKA